MSHANPYLFKAIAGYYVNFYVNVLYNAAHNASLNSSEKMSVTDAYRSKVSCYIQAIKTVESAYKKLVGDLHRYCVKISTRFNSMTFSQFIDSFVRSFVPTDYIESMSANDKDEVFSVVITDLAATLGTICTKPDYLRKIIDNHDKNRSVTCEMLFKESMRCLDNQKDMMLSKFVREISQAKDYISADAANKLRRILDEKEDIIGDRNEEIAELRHQIDTLKESVDKHKRLAELLQKQRIVIYKDEPPAPRHPPSVRPPSHPPSVRPPSHPPSVRPPSMSSPKPKSVPLTQRNLQRHTVDNVNLNKKDISEKVESNIMGSIRKVSHKSEEEKRSEIESESRGDSESDRSSDEIESEIESDKSLTSGKKSVIDNIDGLIFTK